MDAGDLDEGELDTGDLVPFSKENSPGSTTASSQSTLGRTISSTFSDCARLAQLPPDWTAWSYVEEHRVFVGAVEKLVSLISEEDAANVRDSSMDTEEAMFLEVERPSNFRSRCKYIKDVTVRMNFSLQAVVGSVSYIWRLVEAQKFSFNVQTWRLIWLTAVTLADRSIEDDSMQERYVREILGEIAYREKAEFREMQWCIFKHLNYRTSFLQTDLQDLALWCLDADASSVVEIIPSQRIVVEREVDPVKFTLANIYDTCSSDSKDEQ
jgi:hypothetical protein